MEKNKSFKILTIITLIISIVGLTINFAAFLFTISINMNNFVETYYSTDEGQIEYVYTVDPIVTFLYQEIPKEVVQYSNSNDARANFENRPMCLKHKVVDKIVEESYIEFEVTEDMAEKIPKMTIGIYTLKGGNWNESYEENKNVLKMAFGENNCSKKSSPISCAVPGLNAYANDSGAVYINDGSWDCRIDGMGYSHCYELSEIS